MFPMTEELRQVARSLTRGVGWNFSGQALNSRMKPC